MSDDTSEFDAEWDRSLFTGSLPVVRPSSAHDDEDWEARYNEDTTGYVSDPLTTSFTDLDLGPALMKLGESTEWADLSDWLND